MDENESPEDVAEEARKKESLGFLDLIIERQMKVVRDRIMAIGESEPDLDELTEKLKAVMEAEAFLAWLIERKSRIKYPGASLFSGGNPFGSGGLF